MLLLLWLWYTYHVLPTTLHTAIKFIILKFGLVSHTFLPSRSINTKNSYRCDLYQTEKQQKFKQKYRMRLTKNLRSFFSFCLYFLCCRQSSNSQDEREEKRQKHIMYIAKLCIFVSLLMLYDVSFWLAHTKYMLCLRNIIAGN